MMIPIVVISLSKSLDRRAAMRENLNRLGVPFSFFDAIDGRQLTADHLVELDPKLYMLHSNRPLSPGEVGCSASFRAVLTQFANSERDKFLCIIEDDCELFPGTVHFLDEKTLRSLPEFDVLRLVRARRTPELSSVKAVVDGHKIIARLRPGFSTTAQIFSLPGAKKTLKSFLPLKAPFDMYLYRDITIIGLRVLEVHPEVAEPRSTDAVNSVIGERFGARREKTAYLVLQKKIFLLRRHGRMVLSFGRAWGFREFFRLRFLR
jgi:glycosyl transferase family 25